MSQTVPGPFAEGELVNITIRGARVVDAGWSNNGAPVYQLGEHGFTVPNVPGVTVERVAPKEWPPQRRDRWKSDGNDLEWFAVEGASGDVMLVNEFGDRYGCNFAAENFGPMRLLYRDGWTPTTDTAPAAPEQVDERAELVAGYRALADLIEANPDLPDLPRWVKWQPRTRENQAAWIAMFGDVTTSDHPHQGTIQHWATAELRGLRLDFTWIEDLPAEPEPSIDDDTFDATCGPVPPLKDPFTSTRFPGAESAYTEPGDAERTAIAEEDAAERAALERELAEEAEPLPHRMPGDTQSVIDCDDACEEERVAAGTCRHTDGL